MARPAAAPKATARYQLLEKVATGGMAQLFKARVVGPEGFDKLVAVKRILDTYSSNEEFVRMFIDEARLAALLSHPNVVQVFELGRDTEQNLFISMELVNGPELATMLDRLRAKRRRMPEAAALEVMIQVLRGLHHAHTKTDIRGRPLHLVHRDVSPQNILVTMEGVAKLLDFGVAKARGRLTETNAGLVKGKLIYMSPEQSRNKPIDARTDQFAAALVLWECLVGEPCYTFAAETQLLRAVALGETRTFEEVGIPVDPELESAIMAALAPKPEDRFESCEDFADALLRYKQRNFPSYTPTMLGKLVSDTCPKEVEAISRVPDLEGPNVVPLEVASLDVSNLGGDKSKLSKWVLIAGGTLAALGLAGGGVAYYIAANAPPPEQQVVVVQEASKPRTIKLIEYHEVEGPKALPTDLDGGVTVERVRLPDGGSGVRANLADGRSGWVYPLADGTFLLKVEFADGGRQVAPFDLKELPPELPPPSQLVVNSVTLPDGGSADQAQFPDGGHAWLVQLDGGTALALDLEDGGQLVIEGVLAAEPVDAGADAEDDAGPTADAGEVAAAVEDAGAAPDAGGSKGAQSGAPAAGGAGKPTDF